MCGAVIRAKVIRTRMNDREPVTEEALAKGYRQRSERTEEVAEEMRCASEEADEVLGEAPEW